MIRLCNGCLSAVEAAQTLTELLLAVWPLAHVLVLHIVESVLAHRALRPTLWPHCPACGAWLEQYLCQLRKAERGLRGMNTA